MHFWLHACGAVTDLLDDFVSVELEDLSISIQLVAMDQDFVARQYRNKLTFLAKIDVQYSLPKGSAEDVAQGTHRLIDSSITRKVVAFLAHRIVSCLSPSRGHQDVAPYGRIISGREKRNSHQDKD